MNDLEQLKELEQQFCLHEPTLTLLATALSATVLLYMLKLQQHGGITDTDIARVQFYLKDLTALGNDLYFCNKKRGGTAECFDQVAEIIAVLSFSPGGITIFGQHFDAHSLPSQPQHTPDDEHLSEIEQ